MDSGRFFFIEAIPNGIGDFWERFYTLYQLGTSHGLTYLHTPFDKSDHLVGFDWAHFLGIHLDEDELSKVDTSRLKFVELEVRSLVDQILRGGQPDYFRKVLAQYPSSNVLFCFKITHFVTIVDMKKAFGVHQPLEQFKERFWRIREKDPFVSPFKESDKIKVAVHIRRGDRVHIRHWGKWYCVCGRLNNRWEMPNRHREKTKDMVNDTRKYRQFLDRIFKKFGSQNFEVRIYSDGFQTADLERRLALTSEKFQRFFRPLLEKRSCELDVFRKYSNVCLRIGDDESLTVEAFHAFTAADIVVKGSGHFTNAPRFFGDVPCAVDILKRVDRRTMKQIGEMMQSKSKADSKFVYSS